MIDRYLKDIAGLFILLSIFLSYVHSEYWLLFTLFIGANLFQSAFTNWCPMMQILNKLGIKS